MIAKQDLIMNMLTTECHRTGLDNEHVDFESLFPAAFLMFIPRGPVDSANTVWNQIIYGGSRVEMTHAMRSVSKNQYVYVYVSIRQLSP